MNVIPFSRKVQTHESKPFSSNNLEFAFNSFLAVSISLKSAKHVGPDPLIEKVRQFSNLESKYNACFTESFSFSTTYCKSFLIDKY